MDPCDKCANLAFRQKCVMCKNKLKREQHSNAMSQKRLAAHLALPINLCDSCKGVKFKDFCEHCFKSYKRYKKAELRAKKKNEGKLHSLEN